VVVTGAESSELLLPLEESLSESEDDPPAQNLEAMVV